MAIGNPGDLATGGFGTGNSSNSGSRPSSGGGLANSTREGGFAGAGGNVGGGGGGNGGAGNRPTGGLAASTREGGFAGAGVASLSRSAQAQRPTVSPGAGNVASGGVAGLKNATGFFSGAAKAADYDTIQKAIVAARSPLDAFGLKTLTPFGVEAFKFKNDLEDYQSLLAKTPNPTKAQKAQFETLGEELSARAAALQKQAATISGLPVDKAGFSAFAEPVNDPFGFTGGMYNPETYGLTVNKAGLGTAPGYSVAGPYNLGGYEGVYLGLTDKAPTMVTKSVSALAPEESSFAPVQVSSLSPGAPSSTPVSDFRTQPISMTPYPEMRYTYSGPKTGMFEQFGGTTAPGLSTAAMSAGYQAATGTIPASEYARQFFQNRGLSPMQAAALVARFEHESSLNPDKWSGVPNESSYGLAQWNEAAGRLPQLERYAASYNAPVSDFDTQLGFVVREMNTTEQAARNALMGATTPAAALNAVTAYERPKGYTRGNPTLASGYQDTANRFNAIISGQPYRNYDLLSGEEFRGPGSNYAAPAPVATQKQIVDRILPENNIVVEDNAPVDLTGLNANPPLEAPRYPSAPQNIVPAQFAGVINRNPYEGVTPAPAQFAGVISRNPYEGVSPVAAVPPGNIVGRDPYGGSPAAPVQVADAVVQRKTGAPAIPDYKQNFFGNLMEKFTGRNQGNNFRPFDKPVEFADRGEGGQGTRRKPIIPPTGEVSTAATTAPANTGLVWDFESGTTPVVYERPDVYAQYRALFAQPVPVSTGVGSLLPTIEVMPPKA